MTYRIIHSTVADGNLSVRWGSEEVVEAARARFLSAHGIARDRTVILDLEHKDTIVRVHRTSGGAYVTAEALLTDEVGLALFLLTADCVPLTLYDPVHHALALVHLGWKSADLLLAHSVVRAMEREFNTNASDIVATIGPCISAASYVQQEVVQKTKPAWAPYLKDTDAGTSIDVPGYVVDQLVAAGVPRIRISAPTVDTATDAHYFSHYRAVRTGEPEGRFATVVILE